MRNDEEEWERIRTNHEGLLWETRTSFYNEKYDLEKKKKKEKNTNKLTQMQKCNRCTNSKWERIRAIHEGSIKQKPHRYEHKYKDAADCFRETPL